MVRTLVIGDVHGGLRALKQVLERCDYNKEQDKLIFLGDYVDGWSESAELITYLIELRDNTSIEPVFIMGNHDEWFYNFIIYGKMDGNWMMNGGKSTINSYERFINSDEGKNIEKHREFLKNLVEHHVDDKNRAFVHAGCVFDVPLERTNRLNKLWDREMWNKCLSGKHVNHYHELYIGHTTTLSHICRTHLPESKLQEVGKPITVPMNRQNVWNLDTGGGWSGKLSVMDIDTKQFWQSDFVYELYPEEKGR